MGGSVESLVKTKTRSKSDASQIQPGSQISGGGGSSAAGGEGYDTTNLDKEQGNVLMSLISQRESTFSRRSVRGRRGERLMNSPARDGFEQDCFTYFCARAEIPLGENHRFLLSPRAHLWVHISFLNNTKEWWTNESRAGQEPDQKERFLRVMTYYLSGWHIKPKG